MALKTKPSSVAGLIPVSMVDWAGKLASLIFLKGCNLRCPYCHNPELVVDGGYSCVDWDDVLAQLNSKMGWIDGVVITGGEPTINNDVFEIAERLRHIGFPVKLDTNGTRPEVIKELLERDLVQFVAMDIKSAFSRYDQVVRVKGKGDAVRESAELIVRSGIDHEFKTTVVPGFVSSSDVNEIAEFLGDIEAKQYWLQSFNPQTVLDEVLSSVKPFPLQFLEGLAEDSGEFIPTKVRGVTG